MGRTYTPEQKADTDNPIIIHPGNFGHDDIKSYVLYLIRRKKIDARAEVKGSCGRTFDIVVFNARKEAVAIIEVKRGEPYPGYHSRYKRSKQYHRSMAYGLPHFLCKGSGLATKAAEFAWAVVQEDAKQRNCRG